MMNTEYIKRLDFFLSGVIRFGALLLFAFGSLLLARYAGGTSFHSLLVANVAMNAEPESHITSAVLTLIFVVTFAYSLVGALLVGSSGDRTPSLCFSCLFSTTLLSSIIGFGLSWFTPLSFAVWWMLGTTTVLTGTSHFAQQGSVWQ
jgi:hypothetical protein